MKRPFFFAKQMLLMQLLLGSLMPSLSVCASNQSSSESSSVSFDAVWEDGEYKKIALLWRAGKFWQANRMLQTFICKLTHQDPLHESLLLPECFYLQAEMQMLQGIAAFAYHSYTKARLFSHSSKAPWYQESLAKSIYCLLIERQALGSIEKRLQSVERLWEEYHQASEGIFHSVFSSALKALQQRPFSKECAQQWLQTHADALQILYRFPESYSLQRALWMHVQDVMQKEGRFSIQAKQACFQQLCSFPEGLYTADGLYYLIECSLHAKQLDQAVFWWDQLRSTCPSSRYCPKALNFLAKEAEAQGDLEAAYGWHKECAASFPESPWAAESAFLSFPYSDYLERKSSAIKNLLLIQEQFSDSPYALFAFYIEALSLSSSPYEKDHLYAIDLFQRLEKRAKEIENQADLTLKQKKQIRQIVDHALYEEAQNTQWIAKESVGAKRELFTAYSRAVYKKLLERLKQKDLLAKHCIYELAVCANLIEENKEAIKLLKQLLQGEVKKDADTISLGRIHFLLGICLEKSGNLKEALNSLENARESALKLQIPSQERIEIYAALSRLYRCLGQPQKAIQALSQIVNDPSCLSARFEAMYNRAEIYVQQGRIDLAKRQWGCLLETEEPWADKARQRLKEYHVH